MTEIERYLAERKPQDWDDDTSAPVFDSTDFANDIGSATYIFKPLSEEIH